MQTFTSKGLRCSSLSYELLFFSLFCFFAVSVSGSDLNLLDVHNLENCGIVLTQSFYSGGHTYSLSVNQMLLINSTWLLVTLLIPKKPTTTFYLWHCLKHRVTKCFTVWIKISCHIKHMVFHLFLHTFTSIGEIRCQV